MRHTFALAAFALSALALVAYGAPVSRPAPMGEPAPVAAPAPMGEPVAYAPDTSGPWLLIVDRQGEPGESDVADYGLSLGDCFDAMRAQPREAHAACERDRG